MKNPTEYLEIQPIDQESKAFVLDYWLKSYRLSPWAGVVPNNLYTATYSACLQQLIDRGMEIWVLQSAKDLNLDAFVGFVALERAEKPVIHYVFVKEPFRRQGLAKFMLSELDVDLTKPFFYTFRTRAAKYATNGRYRPEIARRKQLGR